MENKVSPKYLFARNTAIVLATQVLVKLASFATVILLANYLSVDSFGRYSFALAFATLFTPLFDLGADSYLIRDLASSGQIDRGIKAGSLLVMKFFLIVLALPVLVFSFCQLHTSSEQREIIVYAGALVAIRAIPGTLSSVFRAGHRMSLDSNIQIAAKISEILGVCAALFLGVDLKYLFIALIATAILQVLYSMVFAWKKDFLQRIHVSIDAMLKLLKGGLPFALTSISVLIYFQIDTVMLSLMVGDSATGLYRSATNLVFAISAFSGAVVISLFPIVAEMYQSHREESVKLAAKAMRFSLLFGLPIAVGTALLAAPIIRLLYKDSYLQAADALRILIWWIPISFATNILGNILGAIGLQRYVLYVSLANAVFNVVANLYLIPMLSVIGASITTVLTELLGFGMLAFIVHRRFGNVFSTPVILKTCIASCILIPVCFFLPKAHVVITIVTCAILYALATFALRLVTSHDFKRIREVLWSVRPSITSASGT